jgi:hypothetical protein
MLKAPALMVAPTGAILTAATQRLDAQNPALQDRTCLNPAEIMARHNRKVQRDHRKEMAIQTGTISR